MNHCDGVDKTGLFDEFEFVFEGGEQLRNKLWANDFSRMAIEGYER